MKNTKKKKFKKSKLILRDWKIEKNKKLIYVFNIQFNY